MEKIRVRVVLFVAIYIPVRWIIWKIRNRKG